MDEGWQSNMDNGWYGDIEYWDDTPVERNKGNFSEIFTVRGPQRSSIEWQKTWGKLQDKNGLFRRDITIDDVQKLIEKGANVDCQGGENETPLLCLPDGPTYFAIAKLLIKSGANVNQHGRFGSPLLRTIELISEVTEDAHGESGNPRDFEFRDFLLKKAVFLLENGANANEKFNSPIGNSLLGIMKNLTSRNNGMNQDVEYKLAKILIAHGAVIDPDLLNHRVGLTKEMEEILTNVKKSRIEGKKLIQPILVELEKEVKADSTPKREGSKLQGILKTATKGKTSSRKRKLPPVNGGNEGM